MKRTQAFAFRRSLDQHLRTAQDAMVPRPPKGWVNAVRRALGMTEAQLARRMGIRQSSVHGLERSEQDETIRLATLRRAAVALDCELFYVLVPRRPLEETVNNRARDLARQEFARVDQTMLLEAQSADLPSELLEDRARQIIADGDLWRET